MVLDLLLELNREQGATLVLVTHEPSVAQYAVEQAFRLPCRYSYRHSPKNVGTDADVAT
jgi:ABC-type lipoprotein export system ATPase subunit